MKSHLQFIIDPLSPVTWVGAVDLLLLRARLLALLRLRCGYRAS